MLQLIPGLPEQVLGLEATGKVGAEDYRDVLVPALEEKLRRHRRARLLYVLGEEFDGYTGGGAWEDAKVGMKHLTAFERVAVVTESDWVWNLVQAFGFAIPGEVRLFGLDGMDEAREWVAEPPAESDLHFELREEEGILILEPRGELEAEDFERLGAELDPYLNASGGLVGLMVVARHFPGWDDLAAFTSHVRFVREHHRRIRRIAIVSDDRILSALPRLAAVFLSAEPRAFAMDDREEALQWLQEG
ncbi:MAG: STAS/SEC14 domain-containing protein [Gemmatimonadota bacterium]